MANTKAYKSKSDFIVYAHRGASEYCPENTMMSFYMGMQMGANGIETDVQRTKDGVLVLFHDDTLERVTGAKGSVADYTLEELKTLLVRHGELCDSIPTFEDFLSHFAFRDISFAIEIKVAGIEGEIADLLYKYDLEDKAIVTSFTLDYLVNIKRSAPGIRVGYLATRYGDDLLAALGDMGAYEICPKGEDVTAGLVEKWHALGLNVRAWGIFNEQIMRSVYDAGADGMTVNFPDLLLKYIKEKGVSYEKT